MSPVECLSGKEMDSGVCCVLGCVETGASMQPAKLNKVDLRQIGFLCMYRQSSVKNHQAKTIQVIILLLYVAVL